jgi:hypothetical protein
MNFASKDRIYRVLSTFCGRAIGIAVIRAPLCENSLDADRR